MGKKGASKGSLKMPQGALQTYRRLLGYLRPHRGMFSIGVLGMVLAVPTVTVVKEVVRLLLEHRLTLSRRAMPAPAGGASGHLPV